MRDLLKQARDHFAAQERALLGNEWEAKFYAKWIAEADAALAKEPEAVAWKDKATNCTFLLPCDFAYVAPEMRGNFLPLYTTPPDQSARIAELEAKLATHDENERHRGPAIAALEEQQGKRIAELEAQLREAQRDAANL